nr:MAG TPA: Hydrogenase maturation factor [Caudoviricetes sp.]
MYPSRAHLARLMGTLKTSINTPFTATCTQCTHRYYIKDKK